MNSEVLHKRLVSLRFTIMSDQGRIALLIIIIVLVAVVAVGSTIKLLYEAAISEERARLVETAQSQARLIESIARFDRKHILYFSEGVVAATLQQIKDAHNRYSGFGRTGEFTLSRREKDNIVFLLKHRYSNLEIPKPVLWDSDLAEPMRQALDGKSGTIIGPDYRGVTVLAAFEPISELSMGIVAKIDLAEIREPFLKAALTSTLITLLAVIGGAFLFTKVTEPMIMELKEHRTHLKELVKKRTTELLRSNKDLEDLAYIVSHDLREPLRGINNFAILLLENYGDKLDKDGQYMVKTLGDLSLRQEKQIISILEYSRAGRTELNIVKADTNKIIHEVIDNIKLFLKEKGVQVRIPKPLPELNIDKVHLAVIFSNLITNAAKYNDKDEKWVEVGSDVSGNLEKTILYVRDNGIGIPERHHEKIFTIFKRLHGKNKFGGGTGVGLAIVKKIVERHNGRIWFASAVGAGTTFYLEFPNSAKAL